MENQKPKTKKFDQPSTETGTQDEGATTGATAATVTVQESPASPRDDTRDMVQQSAIAQTLLAEYWKVRDKEQDDCSSVRSFSSSEGILEDERFNDIEEDYTAAVDENEHSDDCAKSDEPEKGETNDQGRADETLRPKDIAEDLEIEPFDQDSDPKVEGEPEGMASEHQDLNETLQADKDQQDIDSLEPPQATGDDKAVATVGDNNTQPEADSELSKPAQATSDCNETVIATSESVEPHSNDDAETQNLWPVLSHEANVQEVNAEQIKEPNGTSVVILQRDWYLLTSDEGTSLSVIQLNEDGSFKTSQEGIEVFVTAPLPSTRTVVRESHQHVQITYP